MSRSLIGESVHTRDQEEQKVGNMNISQVPTFEEQIPIEQLRV